MHTTFKLTAFKITALCFLLITSLSYAEQNAEQNTSQDKAPAATTQKKQYYIVEVILFRHLNEKGMQDEFWSRPKDQELNNNRPDAINNDIPALAEYSLSSKQFLPLRNGIAALSPEHYKLADSVANLRYSPNYQLLAHFGWTQRSLSKRSALPIKISADNFSDSLLPSGEFKLYVSRFLHLQVDLSASVCKPVAQTPTMTDSGTVETDKDIDKKLQQGVTPEQNTDTENLAQTTNNCVNNTYRFKQNRKMRSKELHYLDNPVYGLLVYVTPFTVEDKEQTVQ